MTDDERLRFLQAAVGHAQYARDLLERLANADDGLDAHGLAGRLRLIDALPNLTACVAAAEGRRECGV